MLKSGYDIHVLDAPAEEINLDETLRVIQDHNPFLVVCDTSTPSCLNDYAVADRIMEELGVQSVGCRHVCNADHALLNSNVGLLLFVNMNTVQ